MTDWRARKPETWWHSRLMNLGKPQGLAENRTPPCPRPRSTGALAHAVALPRMSTTEIRRDIVDAAVERLANLTGESQVVYNWDVHRSDRRRSTIYRLLDRKTRTSLFYKIFKLRGRGQETSEDSLRNRLIRAQPLTDHLIARISDTPISAARVLAAEPDERTLVTLGVAGRELGKRFYRPAVLGKHRSLEQARLMGEACALIEQTGARASVTFNMESLASTVTHRLEKSQIPAPQADRLSELVFELATHRISEGATTFVHGDLSPSNILVTKGGIALIDFGWVSHFRGFDVGVLSYRFGAEDKLFKGWGTEFTSALMSGYRAVSGSSYDLASLHLVNLLLLIRGLTSPSRRVRDESRRKLLRSMTERSDHPRVSPSHNDEFRWWWDSDSYRSP